MSCSRRAVMSLAESRLPLPAAPCAAAAPPGDQPAGLGAGRTLLFATSVAVMVMNLFAVQTVAPAIAAALGLGVDSVGVLAMLPQLGYALRSEEHTSELQSLMRISYAVFCLKKQKKQHHLI